MKKFCISFAFFLSAFFAYSQEYGAGVIHTNQAPTNTPNYPVKPSLLKYDSTEQALYVNSKRFGWFKLISPFERYVRGFINLNFNGGQNYTWSAVESFITQSAGGSQFVKNGYYLVKFTANTIVKDVCTVDFVGANILTSYSILEVSNNDYFLVRYYRGAFISIQFVNDKSNEYLTLHDRQIDTLKNTPSVYDSTSSKLDSFLFKNYLYVPLTVFSCYDTVQAPADFNNILPGLKNFFIVPPAMVGDTLVGVQFAYCSASNWRSQIRVARVIGSSTVQWFTLQALQVPENTLFFYTSNLGNRILLENDRIIVYSLGYLPTGNDARIDAKGLSATLVIKPKQK